MSADPEAPTLSDAPSDPSQEPLGVRHRITSFFTSPSAIDALIALAFVIAYAVILLRTTSDLGYARDEGFYFQAAQAYGRWFELLFSDPRAAVARRAVDAAWGANHEHPALIKSLFALSNLFLSRKLHLFAMEGTSFRFPAIALAGAVVGLVYLWGAKARSRLTGASAAVLLAAMPRFFFQAHLACFDVPIVTMWVLCAYCYWTTLRKGGALWPVLTGVTFGLALDTKHNSWFLPIAFTAHAAVALGWARWIGPLLRARSQEGAAPNVGRAPIDPSTSASPLVGKRALSALIAMAILGPLILIALWPWIWRDTAARLREYALFHLNHEYYNMELFGRNYWKPPMPRLYAPVMTAATVPLITLALAAVGLCVRARSYLTSDRSTDRDDLGSTDLLWLLGIAVSYSAWLSPKTPIFGGTKHWMTAYPFLALFAGVGFDRLVRASRRALLVASRRLRVCSRVRAPLARFARSPSLPIALGASVFAAPVVETARSHPFGLSSYTPLVGGASGAATLGLNRGFWGYTTGAVVDYLNREVRRGGTVYIHDTAYSAWDMLLRDGRLRRDIRGVGTIAGADFGLYHHELHMLGQDYQTWIAFGTSAPDAIGGLDGVPVILVYRRPDLTRPRAP